MRSSTDVQTWVDPPYKIIEYPVYQLTSTLPYFHQQQETVCAIFHSVLSLVCYFIAQVFLTSLKWNEANQKENPNIPCTFYFSPRDHSNTMKDASGQGPYPDSKFAGWLWAQFTKRCLFTLSPVDKVTPGHRASLLTHVNPRYLAAVSFSYSSLRAVAL